MKDARTIGKITDQVISLEFLDLDDVTDTYVGWLNDPEVNQYLEARFQVHTPQSMCDYVRTIQGNPNIYFFKIINPQGQHIGNIKLDVNRPHLRGEISLLIGEKDQWGKGYATRAICLVRDFAFSSLGLRKLTAGCYSVNPASGRAFEKSGFLREAIFQRHYLCYNTAVDRWCYACHAL